MKELEKLFENRMNIMDRYKIVVEIGRRRGCNNKHTIRKDILEEKVITEINNRQATKIDMLNRKYIYDLINMVYLNQVGSIKIEYKKK